MIKFGHMKMRQELQSTRSLKPLIFQFSSLGSLSEAWIRKEFCSSLTGVVHPPKASLSSFVKIVWPTVESVRDSLEGWIAGGSIPCPAKNMTSTIKALLHKWDAQSQSRRGRAMPHIKTFLQHTSNGSSEDELEWFLLTSSNLSKAAWGELQKKDSQLMIRSYEMGVLFKKGMYTHEVSTFSCTPELDLPWIPKSRTMAGFARIQVISPARKYNVINFEHEKALLESNIVPIGVPLPYNPHSSRYSGKDEPWIWDIPRTTPDIYGNTFRV
jgi:tyrosyl-DNA phosphodiesterase-1